MAGLAATAATVAPGKSGNLVAEARKALLGAHFRVTIRCPMADNRVSYFMRAASRDEAHQALRWTLPVCEMRWMTEQPPPGVEPARWPAAWYRGDFFCPANFHHRTLKVHALDLEQAAADVRSAARECRVETADQLDCPWTSPGCKPAAADFRGPLDGEKGRAMR